MLFSPVMFLEGKITFLFLYPGRASHFAATSSLKLISEHIIYQDSVPFSHSFPGFVLSTAWIMFLSPGDVTYNLVVLNSPSSDCRNQMSGLTDHL